MQVTPTESSSHVRRKHARPAELLEAAWELFVQHGYARTTVEAIAHKAGVSKGTLFLYFESKQRLFKEVVRQNISGIYSTWREELQQYEGSSASLLLYGMQVWWNEVVCTRRSLIARLMWQEAEQFPELTTFYRQEVEVPGQDMLAQILQRGMDCGEFRVLPIEDALYLLLTPMTYVMLWRTDSPLCHPTHHQISPNRYFATQLHNCLRGLLARTHEIDAYPVPEMQSHPAFLMLPDPLASLQP